MASGSSGNFQSIPALTPDQVPIPTTRGSVNMYMNIEAALDIWTVDFFKVHRPVSVAGGTLAQTLVLGRDADAVGTINTFASVLALDINARSLYESGGAITLDWQTKSLNTDWTAITQALGDNSTKLATTAFVTSAVGANNELSEILANGNTTGANNISIDEGQSIVYNTAAGGPFTGTLSGPTLTGNKVWTLPDNTGTVALLSDIPAVPNTLYSADDSLTGNRVLTMGAFGLTFTGGELALNDTAGNSIFRVQNLSASNLLWVKDDFVKIPDSRLIVGAAHATNPTDRIEARADDGVADGFSVRTLAGSYRVFLGNGGGAGAGQLELYDNTQTNLVNIDANVANSSYINLTNFGFGQTIPTARVHIKGSGATSATSSLFIQNSASVQTLKVDDAGKTVIGDSSFGTTLTVLYGNATNGATFVGDGVNTTIGLKATGSLFQINAVADRASGIGVYGQVTDGISADGIRGYAKSTGNGIKAEGESTRALWVDHTVFSLTGNSSANTAEITRNTTLGAFDMTGALLKIEDATASTGNLLHIEKSSSDKFIVNSSGNVGIGTSTFGTNAAGTVAMLSGTAPTADVADQFAMYSADIVAGNAAPHFRTETGDIIKIYKETTGIGAAAFVANTSGTLDDSATFGGYTIGQVVAALQAQGLLA